MAVNINIDIRSLRGIGGISISNFRRHIYLHKHILQCGLNLLRIVRIGRKQTIIHTAAHAQSHNCRRLKELNRCLRTIGNFGTNTVHNIGRIQLIAFALVPWTQGNKAQSNVLSGTANHTNSGNNHYAVYAFFFFHQRINLIDEFLSTFTSCAFGQLNIEHNNTLILVWNERSLADTQETIHGGDNQAKKQRNNRYFASNNRHNRNVGIARLVDDVVKPKQRAVLNLFERAQYSGAQCRRQSQRVDRRKSYRSGNGNCKLLINLAGDTSHKAYRNKDCQQHQSSCNHRTGNLLHCLYGGGFRR